jgi:hypothetical protein
MASKQLSWVWTDENGGMQGAIADLQQRVVHWFEAPGCACGSHDDAQTIRDFLARGSRYLNPPDDVLAEMRAALAPYA